MYSSIKNLTRTIIGEDYDSMAYDRIGRIRRTPGYLNNGCIFSNYGNKASRYVFEEIDFLFRTLQNERIILWSSSLKPEYCSLYDNDQAVFTMQDIPCITNDEKLIIVFSPRKTDDKHALFHSLILELLKINRQQAKTRTYLYIDNVDSLIGDADKDILHNPVSDLLEILRHTRRKNIVLTGVMNLPMMNENYCYDFLKRNAAYLLVAGGVSIYDSYDLSRLTGESAQSIYSIASYNCMTLLRAEPQI